jgi:hypothetical protein
MCGFDDDLHDSIEYFQPLSVKLPMEKVKRSIWPRGSLISGHMLVPNVKCVGERAH